MKFQIILPLLQKKLSFPRFFLRVHIFFKSVQMPAAIITQTTNIYTLPKKKNTHINKYVPVLFRVVH
jgi:hypothetical protein